MKLIGYHERTDSLFTDGNETREFIHVGKEEHLHHHLTLNLFNITVEILQRKSYSQTERERERNTHLEKSGECSRASHRKINFILMSFLQSSTKHVPEILTSASQKCLEYLLSYLRNWLKLTVDLTLCAAMDLELTMKVMSL